MLSASRSCWEREATRKTLLLAETERGNTKDRSILMKATFKAKSPTAEGWVFQLWQKSHPYHWGWGNYCEKLYLLALLPVDSFQGRLHLGWAPQVPGPAPLPTFPRAFILHSLASQQPPPEWKVYRTPQTCSHLVTARISVCSSQETTSMNMDSKEIKPVNLKGNQPWMFTGRTDAEAEAPNLGYLMRRANSLEKTLMLWKIEGREGDSRGWDG